MMRRSKYSCAHRESGWVRAGPRCSLPNGPRRAQSKGDVPEYSATCGHTSVAGDMLVSRRAHGETVNQGGTAEIIFYEFTVLDRIVIFCQGFFYFTGNSTEKFYTEVFRFLRSGLFAGSSVLQQQAEKE